MTTQYPLHGLALAAAMALCQNASSFAAEVTTKRIDLCLSAHAATVDLVCDADSGQLFRATSRIATGRACPSGSTRVASLLDEAAIDFTRNGQLLSKTNVFLQAQRKGFLRARFDHVTLDCRRAELLLPKP